jgi:transposase
MKLHVLGIDLGKTVFHLVGLDSSGSVVIRRKCSRKQLLAFTANLQVQLIGMEACSGSHFLGRALHLPPSRSVQGMSQGADGTN